MNAAKLHSDKIVEQLTERLLERQFSEDEIRKIWNLNWMRVYLTACGG